MDDGLKDRCLLGNFLSLFSDFLILAHSEILLGERDDKLECA